MKIRVKKSAKTKENMLQIAKKIDFKKIFEAIKKKREKCALLWIKFAFNELPFPPSPSQSSLPIPSC